VTDKPISTESKDEPEEETCFVECRVATGAELYLTNFYFISNKFSNFTVLLLFVQYPFQHSIQFDHQLDKLDDYAKAIHLKRKRTHRIKNFICLFVVLPIQSI
jgi:hypothetical protein